MRPRTSIFWEDAKLWKTWAAMRPNEAAHESGQAPSCVTCVFLPLAGCSRVSGRLPRLKPAPPARPNQEVKNMSYIEASPKVRHRVRLL